MSIEYYIFNPIGNITALVKSSVPKTAYKDIATQIMAGNPEVEQVGFVEFNNGNIELNMAGDEFCGNAAMSAAALKYLLLKSGGELAQTVLIKPFNIKVSVTVNGKNNTFCCNGLMPFPREIRDYTFSAGGKSYTFPLVSLDGIMHIIADNSLPAADAKSVIKELAAKLNTPALGIMIFNAADNKLVPLVYVAAVNTVFFENSCSSGTCAVAAVLNKRQKTDIIQPGGVISAQVQNGGIMLSLSIGIIKHCFKE